MMKNGLGNGWARNGINPTLSNKGSLATHPCRSLLTDNPFTCILLSNIYYIFLEYICTFIYLFRYNSTIYETL